MVLSGGWTGAGWGRMETGILSWPYTWACVADMWSSFVVLDKKSFLPSLSMADLRGCISSKHSFVSALSGSGP